MNISKTKDFGVNEGTGEFPLIQKSHTENIKQIKKSSRLYQHQEAGFRNSVDETLQNTYESTRTRKYKPAVLSEQNIERGLNKYRNLPTLKQNCIKFVSQESDYTAFLHSNGLLNSNSFQPSYAGRNTYRYKAQKASTVLNSARVQKLGERTTSLTKAKIVEGKDDVNSNKEE